MNSSGFEYKPQWPEATNIPRMKYGWVGVGTGPWAVFSIDTRSWEVADATAPQPEPPPSTVAHLLFLRSYASMGRVAVRCVEGCQCEPASLDCTWQQRSTQPDFLRLKVGGWRVSPSGASCHTKA